MGSTAASFSLIDATIADLQHALAAGCITSVDLTARYLHRISVYDAAGPKLSAIPILNPSVLDEAAASDARRAAGLPARPLEGIPYLVKDSIKVKGMTVASGSPAFEGLVATEDAACVQILRDAGAILLGRTNMPAMAYGGMQRGSYGRAESPYNLDYLTAAYGSGSSNGSATATAANFCAFSLGSETVSSGRSPASNNALVAYTPSRGLLPLRGVWPLYPTCDVLVPHTRTMTDLFHVLDVLAVVDAAPAGDFWNEQRIVNLPSIASIRPAHFPSLQDSSASLRGKCIGVPTMYIGGANPLPDKVNTRPSILKLWESARRALESCGATVVDVDFPMMEKYEALAHTGQLVAVDGLPADWHSVERCQLIAHAWDDFLALNAQPGLQTLANVDPESIFPLAPGSLPGTPDAANALRWHEMVAYAGDENKPSSIYEIHGLDRAIPALEAARVETLEKWMEDLGLDAVVFPANGDIGRADADSAPESSLYAWSNGVKYSNGNRVFRHLGVPTVSVPMGLMEDTDMPVNLTFAGKAYGDIDLLRYAFAFEDATRFRAVPPLVPQLASDLISNAARAPGSGEMPRMDVCKQHKEVTGSAVHLDVQGTVEVGHGAALTGLVCYVNGEEVAAKVDDNQFTLTATYPASTRDIPWKRWTSPALTQTIVTLVARTSTGLETGKLLLL
ncbi:Asp-tRNAAsn/Glu-tRNAGln amidotransferase A subunit [Aspergillus campestris IBT 28561]|uniref:Asp-tRNAAsn/Glu-tRNAGln amidotransferase A subunit n=1 Tax=Aspergillus campestris (strain IBT 28561) TaxID=1392248 RepID=A0A2I1DCL5_ASPC2|nr:Asp-tRNAAsn/Glu-tRNAGln amidotransferase A subunit [Aspergillus campestris IBT 28561]PKY07613.1 Asp-tRNAAsn/Glu-tRNAGln amidotransferase A subunit [Aspergillus campestris IBT 28561]